MADSYIKPNIDTDKTLTKEEQSLVKEALGGRVFSLTPVKNDYVDTYNKGTVEFKTSLRKDGTPSHHNYSNMRLSIPDGTTVKECNFSQRKPFTDAITGKNLTFVHCNLRNVNLDPTWELVDCSKGHHKKVLKSQKDITLPDKKTLVKELEIEIYRYEKDKWVLMDTVVTTVKPHKLDKYIARKLEVE